MSDKLHLTPEETFILKQKCDKMQPVFDMVEKLEQLAYKHGLIKIEIATDLWLGVGIDVINGGTWEEDDSLADALIRLVAQPDDPITE